MTRQTLQAIFILFLLTTHYSCIREDLGECEEEISVVIKVVDAITGEDITASDTVNYAELYIFSKEGNYLQTVNATGEQIRQRFPVTIRYKDVRGLWIATWGNLGEKQKVSELTAASSLDNATVSLVTGENGFTETPDDLFFGLQQVNANVSRTRTEEVVITRKVARMHITVRGLPLETPAEEYYFIVHMQNDGYDFRGIPTRKAIKIKETGGFRENHDLITPLNLNLVPVTNEPDDRVVIGLLREVKDGDDILVASADTDVNGRPIAPAAGLTTNVLIELASTIEVYVETTPWGQIYQWVEW